MQSDKVALVKDTIESFGWNYDPSNPLNKEEQKKAWLSQSQKNVKVKTAIEALGWEQKYSRLRCLLGVKFLVICFYLGWSGSILRFRKI